MKKWLPLGKQVNVKYMYIPISTIINSEISGMHRATIR